MARKESKLNGEGGGDGRVRPRPASPKERGQVVYIRTKEVWVKSYSYTLSSPINSGYWFHWEGIESRGGSPYSCWGEQGRLLS